ncbi:ABC transporter permease [Microbispora tritici]|uniref:ABC transporter permease n=3 Tax=Streptosporangiaceae TaxID=2004 RepID=A0ABY3M4M0_9ACTN|nr:ABC transporter permease [Microbispora fusca]TYB66984.1 ABC transporter permease [Microbispora tritici]
MGSTPMSLTATYKLSARLFWRDKGTLPASVITPLGLAIGMPTLMRNVTAGGVTAAAQMFVGTLALILSGTAFLNITVALTMRRDQLLLKRLRATRLTDRQILLGEVANTVTQTVFLMIVSAVAVHLLADVPLPRNPVLFAVFAVAGSAVMATLGVAWTAAIPRGELAAPMTLPFFFLAGLASGAMGSIVDLLPSWLHPFLAALPTSAVVDAVRASYGPGTFGSDLAAAAVPALVLAVWAGVALLSIRRWFRWETRKS